MHLQGHAFAYVDIEIVLFASAQMTDGHCATCGTPFEAADVVPLNGTAEQVAALKGQAAARRARLKQGGSKGNSKKRKLAALESPPGTEHRDSVGIA